MPGTKPDSQSQHMQQILSIRAITQKSAPRFKHTIRLKGFTLL